MLEFVNILLLGILLKEALTIGNDCVDVSLVIDGDVEGTLPSIKFDVHLDRTVEESRLHKYLFGLVDLLAVHGEGGVSRRLRRELLDVVDELNLVGLVNCSKCDFNSI